MDVICLHCQATKFRGEPPGMFCSGGKVKMTSFARTATVQEPVFMPTFKVRGQIYHRVGSLLPLPNENLKFLQIYFTNDEEQQVDQRCENIGGTRRNIFLELQRVFHQHNNLVEFFKTALERMPTSIKWSSELTKDQRASMSVVSTRLL
ncbi:hypothetical protein ANCDUO_02003 [Ancylostoma duodenale]|uniref:Uncharacterized protein n=1 Tax=Ancylostoma duodenale TaxID=51022 RepID=A0A0C2HDN9_9BILA|nr:hypothetical protein ANCDUO_02003 [Ancylostoma duodenale]